MANKSHKWRSEQTILMWKVFPDISSRLTPHREGEGSNFFFFGSRIAVMKGCSNYSRPKCLPCWRLGDVKNVVHSEWVWVCVGLINGRGDDGPRENNHARKTSSVVDSSEAGGKISKWWWVEQLWREIRKSYERFGDVLRELIWKHEPMKFCGKETNASRKADEDRAFWDKYRCSLWIEADNRAVM